MAQNNQITNFNVESLIPDNINMVIKPYKIDFDIQSDISVANALRRIAMDEIPTKIIDCINDDFLTNDEFLMTTSNYIFNRINQITLNQNIPDNSKFKLYIENNTPNPINITAYDFKGINKYCNNTVICKLQPECFISINAFTKYGIGTLNGLHQLCYKAICYPNGFNLNQNLNLKNSSLFVEHNNHHITLECNGEIPSNKLLPLCIKNINQRLKKLKTESILEDQLDDVVEFTIIGETHTIGNLIVNHFLDKFPQIGFINYNVHPNYNDCKIKIRHHNIDEVKQMFLDTIDHIIDIFKSIKF